MDGQPDLVCLPVAALQHRRDQLPRCHRCDWSNVRRSDCRSRLPSARAGDGSNGQPLGDGDIESDGGRSADDPDERAADASHPEGHIPWSEDLRGSGL